MAAVEFVRFLASRGWTEMRVADSLSTRMSCGSCRPGSPGESVRAGWWSIAGWCGVGWRAATDDTDGRAGGGFGRRLRQRQGPVHRRGLVRQRPPGGGAVRFAPVGLALRGDGGTSGMQGLGAASACGAPGGQRERGVGQVDYPRVVPVARDLVWVYNLYRAERDAVAEATESDYVLVNLYRAPLGRALSPDSVEQLFVRLSAKAGSGLGLTCFATVSPRRWRWRPRTRHWSKSCSATLRWSLPTSTMHARWADMRAAVDAHSQHGVSVVSVLAATPAAADAALHPGDWRVERMRSLIGDPWLPASGTQPAAVDPRARADCWSGRKACAVAACPRRRAGGCTFLPRATARSSPVGGPVRLDRGETDGPAPRGGSRMNLRWSRDESRRLSPAGWVRHAAVHAHGQDLDEAASAGFIFEEFLVQARPLPSFGDCTAGCCYRSAAHGGGSACARRTDRHVDRWWQPAGAASNGAATGPSARSPRC